MKRSRIIALLCFISILSCKENKTEAQDIKEQKIINEKIATADYKTKVENKEVQLIDVRTPKEYKEGHLKSAKNIDFFDKDFITQMSKLDKSKPLYIYCRSGNRSGKAATKLQEAGFTEIYDLKGGFLDWQAQNLSIEK